MGSKVVVRGCRNATRAGAFQKAGLLAGIDLASEAKDSTVAANRPTNSLAGDD
jgi:hypothetical protein